MPVVAVWRIGIFLPLTGAKAAGNGTGEHVYGLAIGVERRPGNVDRLPRVVMTTWARMARGLSSTRDQEVQGLILHLGPEAILHALQR